MKQLVIGSHNKNKASELASLLKGSGIQVLSLADFPHCPEAVESGRTFEANAKIKARAYSKYTKLLTLADDSGLMVHALNGKPGVYSARFAGENCTYQDNNRKLLELLEKTLPSKRKAKFVSVIAIYDKQKLVGTVRGECRGHISQKAKGSNGFGYDPVFVPEGFLKSYAELSSKTKNRISHRGKALRAAKKVILSYWNP